MNFEEHVPVLIRTTVDKQKNWNDELSRNVMIAIQVHLFYPELIPEITSNLAVLKYPYDLYITTNSDDKAEQIKWEFAEFSVKEPFCKNICVSVCENKGRDVVPFLKQMHEVYTEYKYICHIHTKKSKHFIFGDAWRNSLYTQLFGREENVEELLYLMQTDASVGVIYPTVHYKVEPYLNLGANKPLLRDLSNKLGIGNFLDLCKENEPLLFPAGNMFWVRTAAVHQLFFHNIFDENIPEEENQTDGTIMHAIERIWCYVARFNGYRTVVAKSVDYLECENQMLREENMELQKKLRTFEQMYSSRYHKIAERGIRLVNWLRHLASAIKKALKRILHKN